MTLRPWATAAVLTIAAATALPSQASVAPAPAQAVGLDSTLLASFRWRNIGPANMGGRTSSVAGIPSPSKTFFIAAAAGGIWKTTNAGTTFRPVFDNQRCVSMGELAIAPSDTMQVWAGTGEEDSRNTSSPGCGIFKSTDGGLTWKPAGLEKTGAIGRIVVHPTNPNIVYVAALGQAWAANPERGVYKTTDGGQTWQLVKFVSDRAGFIDIAMDPTNPEVLFASSWQRVRGPYFLNSGGPGSALWKTTDGGKTWTEVKGGGFPETMKGRIGLAIAPSDNKVIYALVEADTTPNPKPDPTKAAQTRASGLYRSADAGVTWTRMNGNDVRPFYYSQVRVDPKDPSRVYWSSTPVNFSNDGGKTVGNATQGIHVDHHAMWIDPNDANHFIVGDDGGVSQTWDKGGNYDFLNVITIAQPYIVSYDMAFPYRVCAGLQDNGSWCGPSRHRQGEISNADWITVGGGDGFYTAQDPTDPNIVYSESQGGNMGRLNLATGERTALQKPGWRPRYQLFEDSIVIERPDTTRPATGAQQRRIAELRQRQRADSADIDLRWNWNTPFLISAHNPSVFYAGASKVMKSTNRGENLYPISADLTTRDSMKIRVSTRTTGGVTPDVTGAETFCTIVSLAESPLRPGLLYAGTDDGNVWLTRNDGGTWENLTGRFAGVPAGTYVSRIEPSRFDSATFYVTFDNHRTNDFMPYVYVTTDFGKTFRSIVNNLPKGGPDYVHVLREDPFNRDLLFVGTDVGAYLSRDRGASWQRFMTGLPTVPVHDLKIHPRDRELIAATHGRSIYINDIAPLEQVNDSSVRQGSYFFQPATAFQYAQQFTQAWNGNKIFIADNPPYGASLAYRLGAGDTRRDTARIVITDVKGDVVRRLTGAGGAGMHRVYWDLRGPGRALGPAALRDSIAAARLRRLQEDSLRALGGSDTTAGARNFPPGTDTTAMRGMRDSLAAMRARGDTAGMRALRERFGFPAGGPGGPGGRGGRRGRGGFGSQAPGEINLRPAEAPPGPAQFEGGGGGGGFGFGGRNGPSVPPGDYLVTITSGGQTLRRVLHVERVGEIPQETVPPDDDGENPVIR